MLRTHAWSFLLKSIFAIFLTYVSPSAISAQVVDSSNAITADSFRVNKFSLLAEPPSNKKRIRLITYGNIAGYGSAMIALNAAWYSQYERTSFHTFDDNSEWLQVDKVGHSFSAYFESRYSSELWRWAGLPRKQRIWIGGMSGAVYQTIIETLDGFSVGWGWSWGDFAANLAGSGIFVSQELAWDQQRIKFKFSFHKTEYKNSLLNNRVNQEFGKTLAERSIKDYNAQTYWLSANVSSFFPKSKAPKWLSIAVGYGADGMFGADDNKWTDTKTGSTYDRSDIKRYRQWYLAPDIDLTKLKIKNKILRIMLGILDNFKFPTPSLELSNGNLKWNWLHF